MRTRLVKFSIAALLSATAAQTIASSITPTNYIFDKPTACGSWCYQDAGLTKLTDGVVGNAGWALNSGAE